MLISNKLAIHQFPFPFTLLLLQLATSWFVMAVLGLCYLDVTPCSLDILKRFWPVPIAFLGTLFAGLKAVQFANVETFIVFRATTPLMLSMAEWLFLGRQLPNMRSAFCLMLMLGASVGYTLTDSFFQISGYMWILVWYFVFMTEFLVVKHKVDTVDMTNWGRVYYTNGLASLPLLFAAPSEKQVMTFQWDAMTVGVIFLTCALGVGMSFFSYAVRGKISATYFAIVGNVCKVITVAINYFMWDLHASPQGLGFLAMSLVAAYFYKQAPLRDDSAYAQAIKESAADGEDEPMISKGTNKSDLEIGTSSSDESDF